MSQPASQQEDLEGGDSKIHDHLDPQSTPNKPLHGESNFGDSSGSFFSIYSKAADDEDNKMVERWQKDADGILIFTGLFSAAVAALLSVTVQLLMPNSQDTSAFYLGNIYEVLAHPNATRAIIPSPVAKPPQFSPPRYAIWVNSLWFLSLVISLTCALLATSLHQWSRRYIRVAQLPRCSPEKRARMRAFFADGADKMHIPWAVEGLPMLLHLSVFLFFGGVAVFLFNVNHAVFSSVIWWIGLFTVVYGLITVMPIIRHDSPYYAPLSRSVWFLYAGMNYVVFKVRASKPPGRHNSVDSWHRFLTLRYRYQTWMLGGVEKAAEDTISGRSSEFDIRIFDWTIGVLGDDEGLEKFFEAIPGFFGSKLVKNLESGFPEEILNKFWSSLDKFMKRTLSSNSVTETVKTRRANICKDIMGMIPCHFRFRYDTLSNYLDQAPVSIERLQAMTRWRTHTDARVADCARARVAKKLANIQERDNDWFAFASEVCGLEVHDLRENIAHAGNNVLLATLIDVSRRTVHSLGALAEFDIRHTLPGLQDAFCTRWNELVQEARRQGPYSTPVAILRRIRHLHIALHRGTDAAPTTDRSDLDLYHPSAYSLCFIASHRPHSAAHVPVPVPIPTQPDDSPDASPHHSTFGGSTVSRLVQEAGTIAGSRSQFDLTTRGEIGDSFQASAATLSASPVPTGQRPTDASSPGSANSELLAILNNGTPFRININATPPRLRVRGLVNTGNKCFVNAVLQLLVHSPPFWNLFKELGDLKGRRGVGGLETVDGATPLVDAMLRFFGEFMSKEKVLPPTKLSLQQPVGGKPREEEAELKSVDSFELTYMYDAMREKRQLESLLDGGRQDAEEFFRLYLDALDEELLAIFASIGDHESTIAGAEELEVSHSSQTDIGIQDFMSPISRIFSRRARSTIRAPNQLDAITVEDWRLLRLDIQSDSVHTIQDALALAQSSLIEASRQVPVHFEALPLVLVLHLGRFLNDATVNGTDKIIKPVLFAPELEIPSEIMAPIAGKTVEAARYKLYGVLYHRGKTSGTGHYTVDVLHPDGDSGSGEVWLRIDDEAVSAVRYEDVFGVHDSEPGDDRCVYMLFYCRTAPTWT